MLTSKLISQCGFVSAFVFVCACLCLLLCLLCVCVCVCVCVCCVCYRVCGIGLYSAPCESSPDRQSCNVIT